MAGLGFAGLGLADLLRMQAMANPTSAGAGEPRTGLAGKSIIVLWLWGGPSHMDTWDLKPEAPLEYRGEFRPISTNVPGIEICEHLPLMAQVADKFSLVRSLHHDSPGHVNSTHTMLTGYPGDTIETPPFRPRYPDVFSVATHLLGARRPGLPPYVSLPRTRYNGAAYLGSALEPLVVTGDPNDAAFQPPNLSLEGIDRPRFSLRWDLLRQIDQFRRDTDGSGSVESSDRFSQQAVELLSSDAVRRAFQIDQEDPRLRDRYGRHEVGQRCLLARRLVEAGVRIVTIDFPCVPGQKAFSWDDHASVWNIFEQMRIRLPVLDQVVSATIQDLSERGLDKEVLFVVMGEMSHTPKLSNFQGQPGREHWGQTMSVLLAGGGLRMGQVVGETSHKGDEPRTRPLTPNDLLATWYQTLGVPLRQTFADHAGRPTAILPQGEPIAELVG